MNKESFSLMYSALKMFGKQLYSNESSAISELVANGLDASAKNIYVTIDSREASESVIEVFDDGIGMDIDDFRTKYMKIGYNKRVSNKEIKIMGRKGIGKLAALYLSDRYSIHSKSKNTPEASIHWSLDVTGLSDQDNPDMIDIEKLPKIFLSQDFWNVSPHGTLIIMDKADLTRWGDKTFEALEWKLANNFLPDKLEAVVHLKVIRSESDLQKKYKPVKKKIAFKNMITIYHDELENFNFLNNHLIIMPYKTKLQDEKTMGVPVEVLPMADSFESVIGKIDMGDKKIDYSINGWIGIHSTIDQEQAALNDSEFTKNQLYNPNSVRIYTRNKLAMLNAIPLLENNRAYAHYLEGDISVDILEDDQYPDIATAGRQDFDHTDPRFQKIIEVLKAIARKLVSKRQELAEQIAVKKKKSDEDIESYAKNTFLDEMKTELDVMGIEETDKNTILALTSNKVAGGLAFKSEYTLFISHSRSDIIFTDFIVNLLKKLGFTATSSMTFDADIFYTSDGIDHEDKRSLSDIIKQIIVKKSNDVLLLTTPNFKKSEYCMFEGGAVWATRTESYYKMLTLEYSDIPGFLDRNSPVFVIGKSRLSKEKIKLDRVLYNDLVKLLNRFITHLNKNKLIRNQNEVPIFDNVKFPDDVELIQKNMSIEDYMHPLLLDYWNVYVVNRIDDYAKQLLL